MFLNNRGTPDEIGGAIHKREQTHMQITMRGDDNKGAGYNIGWYGNRLISL